MIKNGNSTPIFANSGTVPNMADTIRGWFQQMTFTRISKTVVNFQEVDTTTDFCAQGVIQPMKAQELSLKPEGQTHWKWFTIHAEPALVLYPGERVKYLGESYKVMSKADYSLYGYVQYDVVQEASIT